MTRRRTPPSGSTPAEFGGRYAALPPRLRTAVRHLALCPGPVFSLDAAAAVLRTTPQAARETLLALRGVGLVTCTSSRRWQMPHPIRRDALGLADRHDDPAARDAVVDRAAHAYLGWAAALDRLITPGRRRYGYIRRRPAHQPGDPAAQFGVPDAGAAVALMGEWSPVLREVQAAAAAIGLHEVAWQFAEVMGGYLRWREDYHDWTRVCDVAFVSASHCGDVGAQARIFALAGERDRQVGHLDYAWEMHRSTLRLARRSRDALLAAQAAGEFAATLIESGHPNDALRLLDKGLRIHAALRHDRRGRALLNGQVAVAVSMLDDHTQAEHVFTQAEHVLAEVGDLYLLSRLSADRAGMHLRAGDPDTALVHLDRAARRLPDRARGYEAFLRALRTQAHLDAGRISQARRYLGMAGEFAGECGLPAAHPTMRRILTLAKHLDFDLDLAPAVSATAHPAHLGGDCG